MDRKIKQAGRMTRTTLRQMNTLVDRQTNIL